MIVGQPPAGWDGVRRAAAPPARTNKGGKNSAQTQFRNKIQQFGKTGEKIGWHNQAAAAGKWPPHNGNGPAMQRGSDGWMDVARRQQRRGDAPACAPRPCSRICEDSRICEHRVAGSVITARPKRGEIRRSVIAGRDCGFFRSGSFGHSTSINNGQIAAAAQPTMPARAAA